MLSIRGLVTGYGASKRVLDEVDVGVPDGEVVAVLGSNGAGKSTLLRTISGTLPMHGGTLVAGTVELDGTWLHRSSRRPSPGPGWCRHRRAARCSRG